MTHYQSACFEFLCRLGDNALVLGHRLSEWCGHAPSLEEDIALANTALDLLGESQLWLSLASEVEGHQRTVDDLAMRRDVWDFRNVLLTEQPNGDFGQTIMRQYLFDAWHVPVLTALTSSHEKSVAEIAEKTLKEARYHLSRSRDIVISLGDGTMESHERMQAALEFLFPYVGELLTRDSVEQHMVEKGVWPNVENLQEHYHEDMSQTFSLATLTVPDISFSHKGGKTGQQHSEHLGHLLTQMQWLSRAYPDATW